MGFSRTPPSIAGSISISSGARYAGAPPVALEFTRFIPDAKQPIDRFALNPIVDYLRSTGADLPGDAPTMFTFADLPLITASGVDPSLLRYVTWYLRHAAAYVADRGSVVYLIDTADMPDSEGLQTQAGAAGLGEYFRRVTSWTLGAGQPIDSLQGLSTDEIKRFYPAGTTGPDVIDAARPDSAVMPIQTAVQEHA